MKELLVLDNYDSFTYNLVHLLREIGVSDLDVIRNDKIEVDGVSEYRKVLLSPGPGIPEEAGIMPELIKRYAAEKPILGICLGHQAIAEAFGASLYNLERVMHGRETDVRIVTPDEELFDGIPETIRVGRYHSWSVAQDGLPDCLRVTAIATDNQIMGISHTEYSVKGLQFHPESVMTEVGARIMRNWTGQ